jgi:glycosyltransferase involved in cell wall biosynthesis
LRLLLCCESYPPHRGGVQEVMRQIAERMAARGHDVTVATSRHPQRKSGVVNGVTIRAFSAGGKMVYGLNGQIDEYRQFVSKFNADTVLIMAAQQWSFDALWPILDEIKARKVFIPCGFSGLYEPDFAEYFRQLPDILRKFDHFVFNAEKYRDIDFVKDIGLRNFTVLPNGISETDFEQQRDDQFRRGLAIPEDAFLFLTVGNPIEAKGHRDVIEAFARLDTEGQPAVLLSVAAWPVAPSWFSAHAAVVVRYAQRLTEIVRLEGWRGFKQLIRRKLARKVLAHDQPAAPVETIESIAAKASAGRSKRVIRTDLKRSELIQAFMAADLFVFASRIEYSPLVLFEAAAAGTPFLTVPVGNADEIVRWTGGGLLCEATKDSRGYTRVDPANLAREMARCMKDQAMLSRLGTTGRERWRKHFTWQVVAGYYEDILSGKTPDVRITEFDAVDQAGQAVSSVA